jgi:2-(1,2-epoxy-1,2-dihydrophenyl)acetyl-CoA isomerase
MVGSGSDEVLYRIEDNGVAWLVLNRPESGNALTPLQRGHIQDILDEAGRDVGVRAIVLTGSGERHFCLGGDLRAPRPEPPHRPGAPDRPAGTVMRGLESNLGAQRFITTLQDCPKPIIAAVNGTAAGFGAHVALACDLIIAADTARFIELFVRRGIIADGGGAYLVTRLVGPQKAKELMFFGDDVPADEALRIGLVNAVVPAAQLSERAKAWADRLAAGPTMAIGLMKRLVNAAMETDRGTAFRDEALAVEVVMQTVDGNEGVQAFVERRPTEFVGW